MGRKMKMSDIISSPIVLYIMSFFRTKPIRADSLSLLDGMPDIVSFFRMSFSM